MLRGVTVALILRILASILANYPDYFPPNFDSLFLQGREATFAGVYRVAFYVHILSAPFVLASGLILLSEWVRQRAGAFHCVLGRIHVGVLLVLVLPSSAAMSREAFGGWAAGVSFLVLTAATAGCAIAGVIYARRRQYARHRRWMLRTYVLICSAVVLRLISGTAGTIGVADPEQAYIVAAWISWTVPLAMLEIAERLRSRAPVRFAGIR